MTNLTQETTALAATGKPTHTIDTLRALQDIARRNIERSACGVSSPSNQQCSAWLMNNPKIKYWFQHGLSEMLFVDGMSDLSPLSPTSYFCAMLSQGLSKSTNAVPLTLFCGIRSDSINNIDGLVCSLTAQLLATPSIQQHLDPCWSITDINPWQLFRNIILSPSLGKTAVFVLVDGVTLFETPTYCDVLSSMITALCNLVLECNANHGSATFKLLVISANVSKHAKYLFPGDRRLVIPNTTFGNQQVVSTRYMEAWQTAMGPLWLRECTLSMGSSELRELWLKSRIQEQCHVEELKKEEPQC